MKVQRGLGLGLVYCTHKQRSWAGRSFICRESSIICYDIVLFHSIFVYYGSHQTVLLLTATIINVSLINGDRVSVICIRVPQRDFVLVQNRFVCFVFLDQNYTKIEEIGGLN